MAAQLRDAMDGIGPGPAVPVGLREVPADVGVTVSEVDDQQASWWNAYVERSTGASIYHRYEWRGLIRRVFGKRGYYLAARDAAGNCRGVLPLIHMKSLLFGNYMVSMPYFNYGGAVADDERVAAQLVEQAGQLANRLGCGHVEYRHDAIRALDLPVRSNKVTMVLPLPDSADALWSSFKPKLRSQIRRPGKSGAVAEVGRADLLPEFYEVFAANMRDLGTPVYPRRFFEAVLASHAESWVCVVRMEGRAVAAGIVLGGRGRLEIPWASSLRSHNRHSPNMLLYWRLLELAIEKGYGHFDFGRCTVGSSTHRFKQQWGAEERQLFWHYWLRDGQALPELNPSNPAYARLVKAWQSLPVSLTKRLGPHIVKHLP